LLTCDAIMGAFNSLEEQFMTEVSHRKRFGVVADDRQRAMSGLEFVQGLVDGTLPLNSMAQTRRQSHQLRAPYRYGRGNVNGQKWTRSRARHDNVLDLRALTHSGDSCGEWHFSSLIALAARLQAVTRSGKR
jgi:hypothetical protein